MSETKEITSGMVTSITDADLVMCAVNGVYHPISFSSLVKLLRSRLYLSKKTALTITGGGWVRIAKRTESSFCAVLTVTHSWSSGQPVPLVCVVNGSADNAVAYNAELMVSGAFYAPSATSNQAMSFTKLRFVKEGSDVYVEVLFKDNSLTPSILVSIGDGVGLELIDATISSATASDVLKTIDFVANWGGG